MSLTRYDLRLPDDVERYLDAVDGEHNTAFEQWRQNRIATGFPVLTVEHPDGPGYVEMGGRWHRIAKAET